MQNNTTGYLSWEFADPPEFVSTYDELPLWSAPFGLMLLKHLELKHGTTLLDIGSGSGFPLLELAQRLGSSAQCYGVDPWVNANNRVREKINNYGVTNVQMIDRTAEDLPFGDASISLIVSNLGINNFADPDKVLKECCRVLTTDGKIAITTNLNGHWREFYEQFAATLQNFSRLDLAPP